MDYQQVSFQWKNPDFLVKNPDFLLKNVDFVMKQNNYSASDNISDHSFVAFASDKSGAFSSGMG